MASSFVSGKQTQRCMVALVFALCSAFCLHAQAQQQNTLPFQPPPSQCTSECYGNWQYVLELARNETLRRIAAADALLSLSQGNDASTFVAQLQTLAAETATLNETTRQVNQDNDKDQLAQTSRELITQLSTYVSNTTDAIVDEFSGLSTDMTQSYRALASLAANLSEVVVKAEDELDQLCASGGSGGSSTDPGMFFGRSSYGAVTIEMGATNNDFFLTFTLDNTSSLDSAIILATSKPGSAGINDASFTVAYLQGVVYLLFDCDAGSAQINLAVQHPAAPHTLRVTRSGILLRLRVDGDLVETSVPLQCEVDTGGSVFVGGLPSNTPPPIIAATTVDRFVGCISNLHIDGLAFSLDDLSEAVGVSQCLPSQCPAEAFLPADHVKNVTYANDAVALAEQSLSRLADTFLEQSANISASIQIIQAGSADADDARDVLIDPSFLQLVTSTEAGIRNLTTMYDQTQPVYAALVNSSAEMLSESSTMLATAQATLDIVSNAIDTWEPLAVEAERVLVLSLQALKASSAAVDDASRRLIAANQFVADVAQFRSQAQSHIDTLSQNLVSLINALSSANAALQARAMPVDAAAFQQRIDNINDMFLNNAVDSLQFLNEAVLIDQESQNISAQVDTLDSTLSSAIRSFASVQSDTNRAASQISNVEQNIDTAVDAVDAVSSDAEQLSTRIVNAQQKQASLSALDASISVDVSNTQAAVGGPLSSRLSTATVLQSDAQACYDSTLSTLDAATDRVNNFDQAAQATLDQVNSLSNLVRSDISTTLSASEKLVEQQSIAEHHSDAISSLERSKDMLQVEVDALRSRVDSVKPECVQP